MNQATQHARLGQPREPAARLAELDALALDVADPKAPALELVQVDSAGGEVAAGLRRAELHAVLFGEPLQRLEGDQSEFAITLGAAGGIGVEVAITFQPATRNRPHA